MDIYTFITLTLLSSCSSFKANNPKVVVNTASKVTIANSDSVELKKGESLDLSDKPMLVEAPGHLGILVVPIRSKDADVSLKLKKLDKENFGEELQRTYDTDMTAILSEVYQVQVLIQEKKTKKALTKVEELKKKFPNVTYLNFLEASCYTILGNKNKAKEILKYALGIYPNNEDARKLYISLLSAKERSDFVKKGGKQK